MDGSSRRNFDYQNIDLVLASDTATHLTFRVDELAELESNRGRPESSEAQTTTQLASDIDSFLLGGEVGKNSDRIVILAMKNFNATPSLEHFRTSCKLPTNRTPHVITYQRKEVYGRELPTWRGNQGGQKWWRKAGALTQERR